VGGFSDGVVVVAGTAIDVFGPFSCTESVIVAPVVISDVVTGRAEPAPACRRR